MKKSNNKKAIISGITGQDGSYLAELLLEKGYEVYGLQRRASLPNTGRIDHLYGKPGFNMTYADLSDSSNLLRVIKKVEPDEFYN
ncbi:MAG: GDP-mannose 4,6-dehydratase, partial [bacterium]|nr:GDP-mannose 4,6-dehydratase [bacterium]